MAYLSDVPMGGYTVFPFVGAFIKPQKVKHRLKMLAKFSDSLITNHSKMMKMICHAIIQGCRGVLVEHGHEWRL